MNSDASTKSGGALLEFRKFKYSDFLPQKTGMRGRISSSLMLGWLTGNVNAGGAVVLVGEKRVAPLMSWGLLAGNFKGSGWHYFYAFRLSSARILRHSSGHLRFWG